MKAKPWPPVNPPPYPPLADAIIREVEKAIQHLGGDEAICAAVGSWNETLDDETVLEILQRWNQLKAMETAKAAKPKAARRRGPKAQT